MAYPARFIHVALVWQLRTVLMMRVLGSSDGAASEQHAVLGQSSGLVRKDVLDLAQVLRDVQGPALNARVQSLVVEVQVVLDEIDLAQFDDLDGHIEGDGDQHLPAKGRRGRTDMS